MDVKSSCGGPNQIKPFKKKKKKLSMFISAVKLGSVKRHLLLEPAPSGQSVNCIRPWTESDQPVFRPKTELHIFRFY